MQIIRRILNAARNARHAAMESVISIVAGAVFIAVISVVVGGAITTATVIIIGAVATIMRG